MQTATVDLPKKLVRLFTPQRGAVQYRCMFGGRGCLHPDALIDTPSGQVKVSEFKGGSVYSWWNGRVVISQATPASEFTEEDLFEVVLDDGRKIIATDQHKFLTPVGWKELSSLSIGSSIVVASQKVCAFPRQSSSSFYQISFPSSVQRCLKRRANFRGDCSEYCRQCGLQPLWASGSGLASAPSLTDALQRNFRALCHLDGLEFDGSYSLSLISRLRSTAVALASCELQCCADLGNYIGGKISELPLEFSQGLQLFPKMFSLDAQDQVSSGLPLVVGNWKNQVGTQKRLLGIFGRGAWSNSPCFDPSKSCGDFKVSKVESIRKHSRLKYWDLHVFGTNNYLSNGIVNHNSGKSYGAAKMAAIWGLVEPLRVLCVREFQASIAESFHAELKAAIASEPWLSAHYDVGRDYLRGANGTEFIFRGIRRSESGIKSLAKIDLTIVEEAEDIPESSWQVLAPTVFRQPKSEMWVIWNPRAKDSPVDKRFRQNPPASAIVEMVNWSDNPFFPPGLNDLRKSEQERLDPATYAHVWNGEYLENSDAQIFAGKVEVKEFDPKPGWDGPYYGGDFGFSQDPTAAVEVWINGAEICIRREAYKTGLELDDTASFVKAKIPGFEREVSRWDNARPESISHIRRHGIPRAQAVEKWPGSVEDGIAYLRSFARIVIHPECDNVTREARLYSYKVDRMTGDVTTKIVDAHNHGWDAVRYAIGPMIRRKGFVFDC